MQNKLQNIFLRPSDKVWVQFFRYGLVAVIAFGVDFGTYTTLVKFINMQAVAAATIGFLLGIAVNYILSVGWVFNQRSQSRRMEIVGFVIIGAIGLALTDAIVWYIAIHSGQDKIMAKLVATLIVFFWNFGARKLILFNKETPWLENTKQL